jgi:PEP-CTERM motif
MNWIKVEGPMKKRLQLILVGSMLLPGSTGVLLASNAHCRTWVEQAATQAAKTVAATKRHYSKKVLAAWAVWRAEHPNPKPVRHKPVLRPGSFRSPKVQDVLGFNCDVAAETVDEAIATILQPVETATAPGTPDVAADSTDSTDAPSPFTLIADDPPPPDTPTSEWPPMFSGPTGYGSVPPSGSPPSGNPPTTGSSAPPPPTVPVAVAAEPSSLLLLGTGIVAAAGLFRRRKLQS